MKVFVLREPKPSTAEESIQFTTLDVGDDLVLDISIRPGEALARLEAAINRPPRRILGLIKVGSEFVGVTRPGEFEVWERRRHAIHALGRFEKRPDGTRVQTRFLLTGRSRILLVAFFILYSVLGAGFALAEPRPLGMLGSLGVLLIGGLAIAVAFLWSALRQRQELRLFVSHLYDDVASDAAR